MAKLFQVDTGGTLTTGLMAYYKEEDANDFWSTNNLTNINSISFASSGIVNNAGNGGATNSNKYLNIESNLGILGGICSLNCWINITTDLGSGGQYNPIYQINNGTASSNFILLYNNGGTKQIWFMRGRKAVVNEGVIYNYAWSTGTWYMLTYTYDGTNVRAYLNGSAVGSPTPASGNGGAGANNHFALFAYNDDSQGNYFSGLTDEVGVWNKALSTQEITDLYNGGNGQTMIDVELVNNPTLLMMNVG